MAGVTDGTGTGPVDGRQAAQVRRHYSFTDLVRLTMRNPRLLLAALFTDGTTDQENAADSTAVQDGETRRVTCWSPDT